MLNFRLARLARLALQNVNNNYLIFSYFRNFVTKSDQKPKTKNEMKRTIETKTLEFHGKYKVYVDKTHSLPAIQ